MPAWQRAYIIATCAIIGGSFAYTANDWGQWPKLIYRPLTGDLSMSAPPGAITIVYFGILAWGLGGAAVGSIVGALLCAVVKKPWSDRVLHLFGAWALTAIFLAGSYYTWNLWPW